MKATVILEVGQAERHLSDGERRSEIAIAGLNLEAGKTYCLCGPSGIGKTTALEMLSLATEPDVLGTMTFRTGRDELTLDRLIARGDRAAITRIRGRFFGYMVQTSRLLPFLTVRENIRVSQAICGRSDPSYVETLMAELHIAALARSLPGDLSGGQRQRVGVARALAHKPRIVLADEPTSAVDQGLAARILTVISDYARENGAAALVITHNTALAEGFGLQPLALASRTRGGTMRTTIGDTKAAVPALPAAEGDRA